MRNLVLATIALFLLLWPSSAADKTPSDDALYDQVRLAIAKDRTVGGGNIQVNVTNGNVELTGSVKQEKIRTQAEKIAKKVKGVKSVDNKIRVSPVS